MAKLPRTARFATLRRAFGLLSDFRFEQSDPDRFYGHLAADTAELVAVLCDDCAVPLGRVLDVGGGPGYFAAEFAARGAEYVSVEPDVGEMAAAGITGHASVRGSGLALPFRDEAFDVTYSSNVAEHVAKPWAMGEEMLRVTRPGGLVILSYTVWLGPFGGHETGLWHYLGGEYARDRYTRKHGHQPKNVFGTSLFDVSAAAGLRWASNYDVVAAFPRYHPSWAWPVVRVPGVREFLTSNLVLVIKRK